MATSKQLSKVVREAFERARREFSGRIEPLGFVRTRASFWTRLRDHGLTLDFIHFHRGGSSYGAPLFGAVDTRVHFGIRVMNDRFSDRALNGPESDPETLRAGRYHLSFNAKSNHNYDRCLTDLVRIVQEVGEPWFERFDDPDALLNDPGTPLSEAGRESLRAALLKQADPDCVAASRELFGLE